MDAAVASGCKDAAHLECQPYNLVVIMQMIPLLSMPEGPCCRWQVSDHQACKSVMALTKTLPFTYICEPINDHDCPYEADTWCAACTIDRSAADPDNSPGRSIIVFS